MNTNIQEELTRSNIALEERQMAQIINLMNNALEYSENARTLNMSQKQGLNDMLMYASSGKRLKSDVIREPEAKVYEEYLKKYEVTYAAMDYKTPYDEDAIIFITKEEDKSVLELIRKKFLEELETMSVNELYERLREPVEEIDHEKTKNRDREDREIDTYPV